MAPSSQARPTREPYGSWRSPITAELLSSNQVQIAEPRFGSDGLYWLEGRPQEAGRVAIVGRDRHGSIRDAVPDTVNVRTRVHEMGGGAYTVQGTTLIFSDDASGRLFRQSGGEGAVAITPGPAATRRLRYADMAMTPDGLRLIAVRETHDPDGTVTNELVEVPADGSPPPETLVSGADFYSFPRVSPAGDRLTWTSWNHPRMPWDGTELWVARLGESETGPPRLVAGGTGESVFQPQWGPEGEIYFVSDRTGWWNIYREKADGEVLPVYQIEAEFGVPQWLFGMSRYAFLDDSRIACIYTRDGRDRLGIASPEGEFREWALPYTMFDGLAGDGMGRIAFIAGSPDRAPELVLADPDSGSVEVVRPSFAPAIDAGYLSKPEHLEFPTARDRTAYAFFYAPTNRDYAGGEGELPPLIVTGHGGPTAAAGSGLNLSIQFWTSRGFAVADVNYGGSTGYGRRYRERLDGNWGVVDVEDCVHAAQQLAARGKVDPARMAIRGRSAGGLTALSALVFHDVFGAGASYYGVADPAALVRQTHKFESRYMDRLIGPWPEAAHRYRERSPIAHIDRLSTPVIVFQGLEDRIVPPAQAEAIVRSLDQKKLPFAYLTFPGEGHGFRKAASIRRALEAELYFYSRIFRFRAADEIAKVEIMNSGGGE